VVARLLAEARRALADDPEGALALRYRKALWRGLAGLSGARTGYERRVRLNQACVRQVLDRWDGHFPGDQGVEAMLDVATRRVAGMIADEAAGDARDRFYVEVVENRRYPGDASAMFVGLAAANTVMEARIEDNADAIPEAEDDEQLDPEAYDTSYMCASAAARGLNGRPADAAARRAFWTWYLDTAIPQVYGL